jgi:aminoglycoside phosphotransferase (APT) family kinase protein
MTTGLADIEPHLAERFPELAVAPLRELEIGFGSVVVETSDGVIFRIARHARASEGHAREAQFLPALRDRLPLAVPEPRWHVEPGAAGFPHGAIGYRKLTGTPLTAALLASLGSETIAWELAGFLLALHRFPVEEAEALGLPQRDRDRGSLEAFRDDVLPTLRGALAADEYSAIRAWWDRLLADPEMLQFTPTLRIARQWELREFGGIRTAVELNDREELEDAFRKLRAGPILAGPSRFA